jgi:uncharacterized protein (UPF0264 family)
MPAVPESLCDTRRAGIMRAPGLPPRLLVSVRDADEARLALEAGVDLIDVKAPERGSLGRPRPDAVAAVVAERDRGRYGTPVSVALGELRDFLGDEGDASPLERLPGTAYVKLGLAGMGAHARWESLWRVQRERWRQRQEGEAQWVAVAYADAAAQSPPLEAVIDAAVEAACAGVLFDTHGKHSRGLLEHVSAASLFELMARARRAKLFCAVAGQLWRSDLFRLVDLPVDVIAVRSAVCRDGDRLSPVCPLRLGEFQRELSRVWSNGIPGGAAAGRE